MTRLLSFRPNASLALRLVMIIAVVCAAGAATRKALMQSSDAKKGAARTTDRLSRRAVRPDLKTKQKTERLPVDKASSATGPNAVETASNYVFSDSTNASFTDMSSGTTILIGPDQDDRTSGVNAIGFDFYFDGVRQDRFSVSTNGTLRFGALAVSDALWQPLGSSDQSLISTYGADQRTRISDGIVHFKVIGTEGNRVLVVEWLNMQSDFHAQGTADLTYQLRLSETSGAIEFVYGSMSMSEMGAADSGPQIGFSSGSDPGMIGSIDAQVAARSFDGSSNAPVSNAYPVGPIDVLTSVSDGSRRSFLLTPPEAGSPGALLFSDVTTTAMTLNWGDTANELGFAIYLSTDVGVTYNFVAVTGANTVNYVVNGLRGDTPYFWRVYAVTEGGTNFIGNNQTTTTPTVNASIGSGAWSNPAIWSNKSVPTEDEAVLIDTGDTVTIQDDVVAYSVQVPSGSTLEFEDTQPRVLTIGTDVIVQSGGVFQSNAGGTATGHTLNLKGDLLNEGTLDFSTNGNTAGAGITFSGTAEQVFSGTGVSNIRLVTVQKGVQSSLIHFQPDNLTVQGSTADSVPGWLSLISGTIEISGTFPMANKTFDAVTYEIPQNAGFWLNNPNYVVEAQPGNANISGLLRVSQSIYNVGSTITNRVNTNAGAEFNIEGGTVNIAGRFLGTNNGANANGTTPIIYNQSGGDFNVATVGNNVSGPNNASFTLSAESTFNMSGGNINLVEDSTAGNPFDYVNSATFVATPVQGTLRVGSGASGANSVYSLRGKIPNFVLDNNATDKVAVVNGQINLRGTTLLPINATFVMDGQVCVVEGSTFTNNGAIIGYAANSHLYFLGGNGPTTFSGTGVVFQPLAFFQVDNAAGVTLDSGINQIIVTEVDIFSGGLTGADKLTLGVGGASNAVVQFGEDGLQTVNGFDVAPVFNAGTGGVDLHYAPEPTGRTTGNEMPPSRTLNLLDVTNPNDINIAGGDVTVNGTAPGALALNGGRVITEVNTLYFNTASGTVVRSTGYVDGFFKKSYATAGSKNYEVGTANGYSPVTVNATFGTFPVDFQVKANQGPQPNITTPGSSLQRYWSLDSFGDITTDITFNYLDPIDVPPDSGESSWVITKFNGTFSFPGGSVDSEANTATITGVSSFSSWTLAAPNAPTAAPATISGQITATSGAPMAGVTMWLGGGRSGRAVTDANGVYRFAEVPTGDFYTLTPSITNYHFSPATRSFSLLANVTDAMFTGTRDAVSSGNVIDSPEYFVRQHYLDFLGREPDYAGLNFWSDQMRGCSNDYNCLERRTINVSAAYFLSIEHQETGGLVDALYRASYGRAPLFAEFMPDRATVARDVIVGEAGWQNTLRANKEAFLNAWVERAAFHAAYDNLTNDGYVDALIGNTRVAFTDAERATLVGGLADGTLTRAQALQRVAENERFMRAKFNEAFVRMQYFGYLRRDPDDSGFHFWLNKLNEFDGNFERAEMVKAFLVSGEYRDRFRQQ
jgi:hypothetical protein